jgi:hypothetical protein
MKLVRRIEDDGEMKQGEDGEEEMMRSDYRWEYREG